MFKTLSKPDPTKFLLKTLPKSAAHISKFHSWHSMAQTGSLQPETPLQPLGPGRTWELCGSPLLLPPEPS